MKTIAIAIAAAASALFVGVPTAHADLYIGPLDVTDVGNWCDANASFPSRVWSSGSYASPDTTFRCNSVSGASGIDVNMDAVCVQKFQNIYPNARNLYVKSRAPGVPFNAFGWDCWNRQP